MAPVYTDTAGFHLCSVALPPGQFRPLLLTPTAISRTSWAAWAARRRAAALTTMFWRVCTRSSRHIRLLGLILSILISAPQPASTAATDQDPAFRTRLADRIFLSSRPVLQALHRIADNRIKGKKVREYIAEVRALPSEQEHRINGTRPSQTCTEQRKDWVSAARDLLSDQGLAMPDEPCPHVISFSGRAANAPDRKRDLSLALSMFAGQFKEALRSPGVNFTKWGTGLATNFMFFPVRTAESYKCELIVDCIIELQRPGAPVQRFFVALVQSYNPRDGARNHSSLLEVVASDLKSVMLRRYDPRNKTRTPCTRARCASFSTVFEDTTGLGTFSHLIPMQMHQVPMLDSTLEENEDKFSMANSIFEDLTPSNIAILVLPVALCFIPISPMADVSKAVTLIYAVITDVFMAVPLVVKGAELLIKFNTNPRTTHSETWVFGNDNVRLCEIWSTQCKINVERETGLVIVVFGLWAITIGLVTEYLAWRFVALRRNSAKHVALLRSRNYIRRVGPDTYQVRSKYLTKMLDGTCAREYFPMSTSITPGSPGTPDMPRSPRASPADFRSSIVTTHGRVAANADSPPQPPVPAVDDDLPLDEISGDRGKLSRLSSLFLRNSVLTENDGSLSHPWKNFFLGLCLGMLMPVFAYFYMHCLDGVQRSRRMRKYYLWGCFLGSLSLGLILILKLWVL